MAKRWDWVSCRIKNVAQEITDHHTSCGSLDEEVQLTMLLESDAVKVLVLDRSNPWWSDQKIFVVQVSPLQTRH
jgi:hypothetical protein